MRNRRIAVALIATLATGVALLGLAPASGASLFPGEDVTTFDGRLQGKVLNDHREFLGVPYAAAATGHRRFAAPAPVKRWTGTRQARDHSGACAQNFPIFGATYPSTEDCLSLDVYTPPAARSRNLPVMVYFYGGAWTIGSTNQFDPTPLAVEGDVIAVNVNYRVGPLGFASPPGTTGNFGFLDQQQALRWLRMNAGAFGGDPQNITLYGESAGGNAVCQHVASPTSTGLFDKAIVQSGSCGSATVDTLPRAVAERRTAAWMTRVGCADLACLREKPTFTLLNTPEAEFSLQIAFRPTVDGVNVLGRSRDAMAFGPPSRVPMLVGGNLDEGRLFVLLFQHELKLRQVTPAIYADEVTRAFPDDAAAVLALYPASAYETPDLALAQVYTDGIFSCAASNTIGVRRATDPGRTWAYEFTERDTPYNLADAWMKTGAMHIAELFYLFNTQTGVPAVHLDAKDVALRKQLIGYWTTFARTGDPNGGGRPAWPTVASGDTLAIDRTGTAPGPQRRSTRSTGAGSGTRSGSPSSAVPGCAVPCQAGPGSAGRTARPRCVR